MADLVEAQAGVLSRRQLYRLGVTRWEVEANLRARRWRRAGSQSVATYTGPLSLGSRQWAAVLEAGPRAYLDGASALVAWGLDKFDAGPLRVSVPQGVQRRRGRGIDVRQTRRWCAEDIAAGGVPRSRVEVAAVRAALWARSDRQAALVLTMVVQQGLTTADRIAVEMLRVRRDRRRGFIHAVLLDLMGGVRSLGELDFAGECRRRGLPEPTRQAVRRGRGGRCYLDALFDPWGVAVEVDGIHHTWADAVVPDALRHNDVTLAHTTVLRVPVLGLRVTPDAFFKQIETALLAAGWTRATSRRRRTS